MFKKLLPIILLISIQLLSTAMNVLAHEKIKSKTTNTTTTDIKNPQLFLLTSDNPPFAYTNSDGNIVGNLVDKLTTVMKKADITYQFQDVPWKRALSNTKNKSDTLIFPISRIAERENDYSWIIPLHHLKLKIYGLKGTFDEGITDITSGKYTFVCTENTVICSVLRSSGVPENSIVKFPYISHQQMISMVFRKRVNFLLISDNGVDFYPKDMEYDKNKLTPLKNYNFEVVEYLAGNVNFDPLLIKKIQAAFKSIPTE